jgi:transcriptional regulator with XRE-family HTH domain
MQTTTGVIGQRIKELQLERRPTLEEVAEMNGCSAGVLPQVERNRAASSISMLDRGAGVGAFAESGALSAIALI